ncbi:MAG: polyphosphate kinase 2 family protein [Phycisphaerae bacterium]|nr:polyphosphate kinase 2 family protein [Phycisphaerae bacterium]
MIDSPHLVKPGKKVRLSELPTDDTGSFKNKHAAKKKSDELIEQLAELQNVLYAEQKRSVLVVLQAIDAGGKDGTISHVFGGVNPQGCQVTSFKVPSELEAAHDFLWRIHAATPRKGMIGIFNRSQYESVLVERVKKLVPQSVWSRRYEQINEFEAMLASENTTILKFFLHISRKEQKKRMMERIDVKSKNWKFNPGDLRDRQLWDDYMEAYDDAIERCSTPDAPWYVVPADHTWYTNYVVSDVLVRTLKSMNLEFPDPPKGLDKIVVK